MDDGSDDRCPEICDRFQKEYENIVVIHQRNHGLPAARNVGINKANGKYIAFCDSDDIMKKDAGTDGFGGSKSLRRYCNVWI